MNAIKAAESVVGVSEAPSMDYVMKMAVCRSAFWADRGVHMLGPMATAFANYRGSPTAKVVLKCVAPSIAALPAIRRVWPNVPCIVIIRNPIEVLVSNLQTPPPWLEESFQRAGHTSFGIAPSEVLLSCGPELCAWVTGRWCSDALCAIDAGCRVVDYEDLTLETALAIAEYFGLSYSAEGLRRLPGVFRVNAKRTRLGFTADAESKRRTATDVTREASERWVESHYRVLRERAHPAWRRRTKCDI